MTLTCPKCQGAMRTYERNGVTIDQCSECRGVFLDRGELEHLVDAEARFSAGPAPQAQNVQGGYAPTSGSSGGLGSVVGEVMRQAGGSRSSHGSHDSHGRTRKKSFMDDLFG